MYFCFEDTNTINGKLDFIFHVSSFFSSVLFIKKVPFSYKKAKVTSIILNSAVSRQMVQKKPVSSEQELDI